MKDAFGVVSKHRSKVRLILRELGSNSTSAGYTQVKRRSKVKKGMHLPGGTRIRLRSKTVALRTDPGAKERVIQARDKGKYAGVLALDQIGGVNMVETAAPYQRKGVATHMWKTAQQRGWNPQHSSFRSDAGDAWARSVGGHRPTAAEEHKRLTDYYMTRPL